MLGLLLWSTHSPHLTSKIQAWLLAVWQAGRCLAYDSTVVDTLTHLTSKLQLWLMAVWQKAPPSARTPNIQPSLRHIFVPLAVETLEVNNQKGVQFLSELANRLTLVTDDPRESSVLFQRISILIQRFNTICFQGTFDQPAEFDF